MQNYEPLFLKIVYLDYYSAKKNYLFIIYKKNVDFTVKNLLESGLDSKKKFLVSSIKFPWITNWRPQKYKYKYVYYDIVKVKASVLKKFAMGAVVV